MKLNRENFANVAKLDGLCYSDEQLLESIEVHKCLLAYFRTRKEHLISFGLQIQLNTLESNAHFRENWKLNEKDEWNYVAPRKTPTESDT